MDDEAIREQMRRAIGDFAGPVRRCALGETAQAPQEKKRPPSHRGEEKRIRRNADKHGYRLHKPRGQTRCTLIGIHDRIVLEDVTLEQIDAFLGGAPPNAILGDSDDSRKGRIDQW